MYAYFAMLGVPAVLALTVWRPSRLSLLAVSLIYFILIGFRFQVGMDWNNYLDLYELRRGWSLAKFIISREPGYGVLTWVSATLGWGIIFINAVAALVFCLGFFAVAERCREPWLAIAIATPLLAIAFAMSGVRQAIAVGIIFYLVARWDIYSTFVRIILVLIASTFHFSSAFMLIFVALGANASYLVRVGGAFIIALFIVALVKFSPASVEAYSRLYVASGGKLTAPGAIFQLAPLASAALIYLTNRDAWTRANGDNALNRGMAWASIIAVPAILVSSVGSYRFALYLWPMAMTIYSGIPGTIESGVGRAFYRICIVAAAFALLFGWLQFANNSYAWLPYQNWLIQPEGVRLWRSHYR